MLPLLLILAEVPTNKPQLGPIEKEHKMVVKAVRGCDDDDPDANEIVICSRDRGVAEAYRLPKLDPRFAAALRKNGRGELTDPALGAVGAGSCSASGAGGATGCTLRNIQAWAAEQKRKKAEAQDYASPN